MILLGKASTAFALCTSVLFVLPQTATARGTAHGPMMKPQTTQQSVAAAPVAPASASSTKGCTDPAACALQSSTMAQQSNAATLLQSTTTPAVQAFPAAAPPAPPVVTAPSAASLTSNVAVDASSGGTSRIGNPGASGPRLAECMTVWEPALHMSKGEWRATCVRTLNGVDLPQGQSVAHVNDAKPAKHANKRHPQNRATVASSNK